MRGHVPDLLSPHPLGGYLPAIYQDVAPPPTLVGAPDVPFVLRFTSALDEVLAPVFITVDNFSAYLDPALAPEDFLEWLGSWVGVALDQTWPIERRRAFVSSAVELFRQRGTVAGLRRHLEIVTGGEVEITENGGTAWSDVINATMPGSPAYQLAVKVKVADPKSLPVARLDALVAASKPAHVPHTVEVASAG